MARVTQNLDCQTVKHKNALPRQKEQGLRVGGGGGGGGGTKTQASDTLTEATNSAETMQRKENNHLL